MRDEVYLAMVDGEAAKAISQYVVTDDMATPESPLI